MTFRYFKTSKSFLFINSVGLTIGLTTVLLIYLWASDELSIDKFLEGHDQTFQVLLNTRSESGIQTIEATPYPLARSLKAEVPEVEFSASVIPSGFNMSKGTLATGDVKVSSAGQYASQDFFEIFSYPLVAGNRSLLLENSESIVISDHLAQKLFHSVDLAVGKSVEWSTQELKMPCVVTGVFKAPPSSATIQFDFVLSFDLIDKMHASAGWSDYSPITYVRLHDVSSKPIFEQKLLKFISAHDKENTATLFIQKVSDRYLYGNYENGMVAGGRISYVRMFVIVGCFVLIMACVNFSNLSIARSFDRVKSVGIAKVLGAKRRQTCVLVLFESICMVCLSLSMAVLTTDLMLEPFNALTGKHLALTPDFDLLLFITGVAAITGLFAGLYPALTISAFHTVDALKGRFSHAVGRTAWRKPLIILQFSTAVLLTVLVVIIYSQMTFIHGKNLGFNRKSVLYFNVSSMTTAVLSELRAIPGVVSAGGGRLLAGNRLGGTNNLKWEGKTDADNLFVSTFWLGDGLMETLEMQTVAGETLKENKSSQGEIVFNETAIARMNLKDPVGKTITFNGEERRIVGIVRDFYFESLYNEVKPCALILAPIEYAPTVSVRIASGAEQTAIAELSRFMSKTYPGEPFNYRFMEDDYQKLYSAELRMTALGKYFATVAILIASLGLFGLSSFTAQRRQKEVGIRKVLGSGTLQIVWLLSVDFGKTVLIAISIVIPVAYLIAKTWLDGFAYKIDLSWWYFAISAIVPLLIAFLTVASQALTIANINPTKSIKND